MKMTSPQVNTVMRQCLALCRNFLSGLFIVCLVIHFLVKDGVGVFAFVYYATPLPILASLSLMLGLLWWLSKRMRFAKIFFVFTLGSLVAWSYESFSLNSRASTSDNLKIFFWNAAGNQKTNEIADYVNSFDADLIGIVEAGIKRKQVSTWQNLFPNHHVEVLRGSMALITKGKILSKEKGSLGGRGRFNLLEVELKGERFQVLLVDFDSDPLRSRSPAFEPLFEMIRTYAQTNLIVMGDFNTPHDSVFFESLRLYLAHAFETGGTGFAKTWPIPVPILAIDHIWVSKKIKVVNCNLNWSRFSDHRPVVANIELPFHSVSENLIR